MAIVFLKFLPKNTQTKFFWSKNTQIRHFQFQIQAFLFFYKSLQIDKYEGADFKYDNSFITVLAKNQSNKGFLVKNTQIQAFFIHKTLQLDKVESIDFKYDNSFLIFQPKNTQTRHFWSQNQAFFPTKFCYQTNSRVLISNMTILFLNSSPKIPKSGISSSKFRHFCFFINFCKQTNMRGLISNMTIVSLQFLPKISQIRHFWSKIPKFRHFCLFTKLCNQTKFKVMISNMTIVF